MAHTCHHSTWKVEQELTVNASYMAAGIQANLGYMDPHLQGEAVFVCTMSPRTVEAEDLS